MSEDSLLFLKGAFMTIKVGDKVRLRLNKFGVLIKFDLPYLDQVGVVTEKYSSIGKEPQQCLVEYKTLPKKDRILGVHESRLDVVS